MFPTADTYPPKFTLYDTDMKTRLGYLQGYYDAGLDLMLDEAGSGSISLYMTNEILAKIKYGQYIACDYRGAWRGGFLVDHIRRQIVQSREFTGRIMSITGRGEFSLLADAIVWDWGTPDRENRRKFGVGSTFPADTGAAVSMGSMIWKLLDEARNIQSELGGSLILDRYCWRKGAVVAGTPIFAWDFTAAVDSNGNAWPDTSNMGFDVGMSLLDVVRQIAALQYDFKITFDATTGLFTLHAYKDRIGNDKTNAIRFREGENCLENTYDLDGTEVRNALLVGYNGTLPYVEVKDATSLTNNRRRESLLTAQDASDVTAATLFGTQELAVLKDPQESATIVLTDAEKPRIFIDYGLGDLVAYHDGLVQSYPRVTGAKLTWTGIKDEIYAGVSLVVEK